MSNNIFDKLKQQKSTLESQGYNVTYICLYGSQNYNLDIHTNDYQSDVDMKAIVVPTLDDLINNSKPVSTVIDTEWGQCDIKDIRKYFETLLKANPAYVETLFTKYYIVDDNFKEDFDNIHNLRDELVNALRAQMLRAMYGMMLEKEKALCHPYPSIANKIEKFGYCGKQASHTYRLWLMMQDYYKNNKPLSECFYPPKDEVQILMDLKLNKYPLDYAKEFVSEIMAKAKLFKDSILKTIDESVIDYSIKDKYIILSQSIIKNKIINDIRRVI